MPKIMFVNIQTEKHPKHDKILAVAEAMVEAMNAVKGDKEDEYLAVSGRCVNHTVSHGCQVAGGHGDGPGGRRHGRLVHHPARGHLLRHHRAPGEGSPGKRSCILSSTIRDYKGEELQSWPLYPPGWWPPVGRIPGPG